MTRKSLRRIAGAACLIAYLCACTSWHAVLEPPERVVTRDHPSAVRVTTDAGRQVIESPAIQGDTLAGTLPKGEETSVALGDVRGVEVRKSSAWKTIGLVYLALNVALLPWLAGLTDWADSGDGG